MKKSGLPTLGIAFLLVLIPAGLAAQAEEAPLNLTLRPGEQSSAAPYLQDAKQPDKYAPDKLFDGSADSCWAIGNGGPGVEIFIVLPAGTGELTVQNGFATSMDLFEKNNRVKSAKARLYAAFSLPGMITETDARGWDLYPMADELVLRFRDAQAAQSLALPFNWALVENSRANQRMTLAEKPTLEAYFLRLEIAEVYKGSKWNDTCISELAFAPGPEPVRPAVAVYANRSGSAVLMDTAAEKGLVLVEDRERVMNVSGANGDLRWVIVESIPAEQAGAAGRTTPSYELYSTLLRRKVDPEAYGERPIELLDWVEENGKVMLAEGGTRWFIDLDDILAEMARLQLKLRIGKGERELGGGLAEKSYPNAVNIDVMPALAARAGKLYVCDAINFRLLVFDYSGRFLATVAYPARHPEGGPNVVQNLAVGEDSLFLVSGYPSAIYELDREGKVLCRLTGADTKEKRFGNLSRPGGNGRDELLVPDSWQNYLYRYSRKGKDWRLAGTSKLESKDEIYLDSRGVSFLLADSKSESGFDLYRLQNGQRELIAPLEHPNGLSAAGIIGIDARDRLYIAAVEGKPGGGEKETGRASVKVLSAGGKILYSYPVEKRPVGSINPLIAVDEHGTIFEATTSSDDPRSGPDDRPNLVTIRALN